MTEGYRVQGVRSGTTGVIGRKGGGIGNRARSSAAGGGMQQVDCGSAENLGLDLHFQFFNCLSKTCCLPYTIA